MAKDIYEIDIGTFRMSLRGMSPDKLRALAEHLADTADAIEDEARRAKAGRTLRPKANWAHFSRKRRRSSGLRSMSAEMGRFIG